MQNELTLKASIPELLANRQAALDGIENALLDLKKALNDADSSCVGSGGCSYDLRQNIKSLLDSAFGKSDRLTDKEKEGLRATLDRQIWRSFVVNTPLYSLMDRQAKEQFERDMQGVPPVANIENLSATMGKYFADSDTIFVRSIINTFNRLDCSTYKTNDAFKLGEKIIVSYVQDDHGYLYSSARESLYDLDRVAHILDGKEPPIHGGGLVGSLTSDMSEARQKNGWKRVAGTTETEYFAVKWFKKGTAHITLKRDDLRQKINNVIAEYYGETLPDNNRKSAAPDRDDLDENYYPTPHDIALSIANAIDLEPCSVVLEPSAGDGALIRALHEVHDGITVEGYEINPDRARQAGVVCAAFLDIDPNPVYDAVVMNPPFSHNRYALHVAHAFRFLKPGGVLLAITPNGFRFDASKPQYAAVADSFVDAFPLPKNCFAESGKGTRINLQLMIIEKST